MRYILGPIYLVARLELEWQRMKERGIIYICVKPWLYRLSVSFGSAVNERTRNDLYIRYVLGLYI